MGDDSLFSNNLDEFITEEPKKKGGAKKCIHNKTRCKECRNGFCKHGKDKRWCKEGCGGSSICKHGKGKAYCKECGGNGLCIHNTNKYTCSKCGNYNPERRKCGHGKIKSRCKECGGSEICEHDKRKGRCIECSPKAFCKHGKIKSRCKECGGSEFCEHGKMKIYCKDCGGSGICEHGKMKIYCKDCGGSGICEHGIYKRGCKSCGGNDWCKHGKRKNMCKECGGSKLCKSSWCETIVKKKYEGYCMYCFINLFPDKPVTRNYKTKEKDVVDRVKEFYPDFDWIHDKKVQDGCSKRRPDLLLDLGSHIIIIEIDENKHSGYDCSCENKRLMELSQDVHHRPIVFIRFNPDKYIDEDGNTIKSCWRLNKHGIMTIAKTKEEEWKKRVDSLKNTIHYWVDNMSDKTVEIIELFY
jgi:hypothetical protein